MKRCAILVLYDKDGIFDDYIFYLIEELHTVSARIIAVINGTVNDQCLDKLQRACEDVIVRENTGYDARAYAHVITNYLTPNSLKQYDELLLCNDTFFGPLKPFKEIFSTMEQKPCDFWGISYTDEWFDSFLHSYFMVFRSKIISNEELEVFFSKKTVSDIKSYADSGTFFERGLFEHLTKAGYTFDTLMGLQKYSIFRESNQNIRLGYPLLKKKAFLQRNYSREVIMDALQQISLNSKYDIQYILQNIHRTENLDISLQDISSFSPNHVSLSTPSTEQMITKDKTLSFIRSVEKLYIYGVNGALAHIILQKVPINNLAGFVVSPGHKTNDSYKNYPVYEITDLVDSERTGIIVALWYQNSCAVKPYLARFQNVLYLFENI